MADAIQNKHDERTSDDESAMLRLLALMKMEHVALLAELLETIVGGSGYGGVEIVISEKKIQTLKLTQSFKPVLKLTPPGKQPLGEL